MFLILFLNYFFIVECLQFLPHSIDVRTKVGTFRGEKTEKDGTELHIFKGIRYGAPPIGNLRFKKPLAYIQSPDTVIETTTYGHSCPQLVLSRDEDCLFLNIWAPKNNESLPVMFWIYGGAFQSGTASTDILTPWPLAVDGGVVVVSFNYRVGAFGFLFDGTEDAPGNMGLYDQLLALLWVKDHISHFGGDPKMITIFGESAGSISVGALILSPLSKGLFQRAIMQSGAPNVEYITRSPGYSWKRTQMVAQKLNCWHYFVNGLMMECLRSKSIKELIDAEPNLGETFLTYGTEFLPLRPAEALLHGVFNSDIDLIFGVVEDEGSIFIINLLGPLQGREFLPGSLLPLSKAKAEDYIEILMRKGDMFTEKEINFIKIYYLGPVFERMNASFEETTAYKKAVARTVGDSILMAPTIIFGGIFAQRARGRNVYSYRLTHMMGLSRSFMACLGWMGVCHGADIPFVFGFPRSSWLSLYSQSDKQLSADMVWAWTNFAKTGEIGEISGVKWQTAFTSEVSSVQYMQLDPMNYTMVRNSYVDLVDRFWRTILDVVHINK